RLTTVRLSPAATASLRPGGAGCALRCRGIYENSVPLPDRPPLFQERRDSVPDVIAGVAELDQIVVGAGRQPSVRGNPAEHLLGRADRQRRVRGNLSGKVAHKTGDPVRLDNAVDEPGG